MNKKILLVITLLMCCVVISGCSFGMKEVELKDEYAPFLFKVKYPKEDYIFETDLEHTKYVEGTLKNAEKNIKMKFSFSDRTQSNIAFQLENLKKDNLKKTEYTELGGYEYYDDKEYYGVSLFDKKTIGNSKCSLVVQISKLDYRKDVNIKEFVESKDFKKIMKSISFDGDVKGKKVNGVIADNHKLVVKHLKAGSDYTVEQYPSAGNGVMNKYFPKDGKFKGVSGAYFTVGYSEMEKTYENIDKLVEKREAFKQKYKDVDLYGLKVKSRVKENNIKYYSKNLDGYFEKDGKIFNFTYYQYEGVKDEIGQKLVQDVISNLSVQ